MKYRSTRGVRFALNGVALAAACLWGSQAWALGLGRLTVQSALGESLRAEIEVTSLTPEEASTLQVRVAPAEAYRAAGVDYNAVLPTAQVQVVRRPDGRAVLRVTSDRAVLEPFMDVIIEASWASGRLVRDYTLLFDPPGSRFAQGAAQQAAAPVLNAPAPAAAAPMPAPRPAQAPRPPAAEAPRQATAAAIPAPAGAPQSTAGGAGGADRVRVQSGDTLYRVAGRTQRSGVSLDQMLVSLFRANPQAFMGENMNRLKAGSVLSVPSAEQAAAVSTAQARELIVAQSADFAAYRQRLASGGTAQAAAVPARQATGQVQAQVDDSRQPATPTPDRLTLSQGGLQAPAPAAAPARPDTNTRLAELARNVEELKRLQGGATAAAPATPGAPAAGPAAPAPAVPAPSATEPPVVTAQAPAAATAPAAPDAPAPRPPVPTPAPAPDAPADDLVSSLLDNPLLLPAAGVLVALLAGLGLWQLRSRMRKQAGETSFLESRLQPDSFFGASGGQRVDTREPASAAPTTVTGSSTMSYSLSQLDAIGDVDAVAEADVYLAYGRDLQAEEILKEAMRAQPERLAIRLKLLEVYAKRRDTKGFELLATQIHSLTHGQGEDWAKAQELGRSIDPENALYSVGGHPGEVLGVRGVPVEPLGASTVPYSAPARPPAFQPAADATLDKGIDSQPGVELDLDLTAPAPLDEALPDPAAVFRTEVQPPAGGLIDLDLMTDDPRAAAPLPAQPTTVRVPRPRPSAPGVDVDSLKMGLDFDLGDLDALTKAQPTAAAAPPRDMALDFGDFGLGEATGPASAPGDADPLARKLELAEEFRQIGDIEGARDLLEEVVAKAEGALRVKAQGMLDTLR